MTDLKKLYWIRKKGTKGVSSKNGLLVGRSVNGKSMMTDKPAIACVFSGGLKLDVRLAENPEYEAVEVVEKGERKYHGRILRNFEPVDPVFTEEEIRDNLLRSFKEFVSKQRGWQECQNFLYAPDVGSLALQYKTKKARQEFIDSPQHKEMTRILDEIYKQERGTHGDCESGNLRTGEG